MTQLDLINLPDGVGPRAGCEAFQIAIDIASTGALAAAAAARLDQHLATCSDCVAYKERSALALDAIMSTSSSMRIPPTRWNEIEAQIVRNAGNPWPWIRSAAMLSIPVLALLGYLIATSADWQLPVFLLPLSAVVVIVVASFRRYGSLRDAVAENDVMGAYRGGLERAYKVNRWVPWLFVTLAALQIRSFVAAGGAMSLVIAGLWLMAALQSRANARRIKRELAVLS